MPWGCLHSARLGGCPFPLSLLIYPPLTLPSLSRHTRPWLRGRVVGPPTAEPLVRAPKVACAKFVAKQGKQVQQ